MGREIRIALIMGGGVSLGTFSGGALAEVVRLLARTGATREDGEKIEPKIDVMAGASAGSLTLAILFAELLRGGNPQAIRDSMSAAWVDGVGVDYLEDPDKQLLPEDLENHQTPSLVSDRPIRRLAKRYLPEAGVDASHASRLLADEVYVSFSVANLNGVDVRAPWQVIRRRTPDAPDHPAYRDALVTTFHDDRARFVYRRSANQGGIDPASQATRLRARGDPSAWAKFRDAAIASGAFPFAFAPVALERKKEEYGPVWPQTLADAGITTFPFTYMDGGSFRNEPLKEGIELAKLRDREGEDAFERVFIFIDPNVSGSHAVRALSFTDPLALRTDYAQDGKPEKQELARRGYADKLVAFAGRYLPVVAGQAAFRDWIKAEKTNSRVEWNEELERVLCQMLKALTPSTQSANALQNLLHAMYATKLLHRTRRRPRGREIASVIENDRAQLRESLPAGELPQDPTARNAVLDVLLALRNVAGLRNKRKLNLVAITPYATRTDPLPLAGNFFANFGGFFKRDWREHDFRIGGLAAWEVLTADIGSANPLVTGVKAPFTDPPRLAGDAGYAGVESSVRDLFEEKLHDHIENIASALEVPDVIDDIVASKVIGGIIKGLHAPHTVVRHILVRLSSRGLNKRYELRPNKTGFRAEPTTDEKGNLVIETVVSVHYDKEAPPRRRYWFEGPHVHNKAGKPTLRLARDILLELDQDVQDFTLEEGAKSWYEAADTRRFLPIRWNGKKSEDPVVVDTRALKDVF
ncbi:MAG: hypothetical protein GWN84_13560 [Gammaproteobacteria bacterium]|nr:hypothetical protein [Gammaproteobacteria bacterium]NIR83859.1 hypothetical protein [Gammaproteobacteria bacterium]NIR88355.1 hypothetical protein [Gammaproteobacteria bacterium]NIU05171.1 hypothetical protein [Gammaproteobacteria bacterium]NIV52000.1 hypothetical protein [Gammaproteobacteria bacterium]